MIERERERKRRERENEREGETERERERVVAITYNEYLLQRRRLLQVALEQYLVTGREAAAAARGQRADGRRIQRRRSSCGHDNVERAANENLAWKNSKTTVYFI